MASIKTVFNNNYKLIILFNKSCVNSAPTLIQKNGMSQYPSYYVKPIYEKSNQEEIFKSGEHQKLVHVPTRAALNDQTCSVYHDSTVNLFINHTMKQGKKVLARDLLSKTFEKIKRVQIEKYHKASEEEKAKIELSPKAVFHKALENCKPLLELTPIKRGGVTYQVPVPVSEKRSLFKTIKWFIEVGREKLATPRPFWEKLAYELIDAADNKGKVIKRKRELHQQCEANKAYAHYRWLK